MKMLVRASMSAAALAMLAGCNDATEAVSAANAADGDAVQLATTANEGLINLRGTVLSTTPSTFMLDYGGGNVLVEMDDWDWFQEGRALNPGDRVTVTGRVDRDLLEGSKVEANSVFVENLGTYFYAAGNDEEDLGVSAVYTVAPAGATDVVGTVTAIEGREFTLGSPGGAIRVDTSGMAANPLDAEGQPRIQVGSRVYVWGALDIDPQENDELRADGLVLLQRDRTARLPTMPQGANTNAVAATG